MDKLFLDYISDSENSYRYNNGLEIFENLKIKKNYSDQFRKLCPDTVNLFEKASITQFKINCVIYNFFGFQNNSNKNKFGILVKPTKGYDYTGLAIEHKLFLEQIGEIIEFWKLPYNIEFNNIIDLFRHYDDEIGLGDFENDYIEKCYKAKLGVISELLTYHTFSVEGNGNRLMYGNNGEIVLYAHDHNYKNIIKYKSCPEFTFYKYKKYDTLNQWMEKLFSEITLYLKL